MNSISSPLSQCNNENRDKVKIYVKDLLKSRIFLGRYTERRLVNEYIGYRDIVLISNAESELKRDLIEAQHKLCSVYPNVHWIGITNADALGSSFPGLCLWTEIDNEPFGAFWFQIKTIKFRDDEILISLRCLRHINDAYLELEPILTGALKITKDSKSNTLTDIATVQEICKDTIGSFKNAFSFKNLKELITVLIAFIIAIFTGSTAFINFLGNFTLALIRESSVLIKNSTPLLLGILDFFSKIVGGFYILIAMFFRPSVSVPVDRRKIPFSHSKPWERSVVTRGEKWTDQNNYNDKDFD